MVKVGHKQVVSLIRQGGNHLVMKVVSVSRKPESEEVVRKKGRWRGLSRGGGAEPGGAGGRGGCRAVRVTLLWAGKPLQHGAAPGLGYEGVRV